jgi:hypothetical protein
LPDLSAIQTAWMLAAMQRKPKEHSFLAAYQPTRPMTAIGG